jgi:hypothetical protein
MRLEGDNRAMAVSVEEWLVGLCDPKGPREGMGRCELRGRELKRLQGMAERHGVLPAVVRNLRAASLEAYQELERNGVQGRLAENAAMGMFLRVMAMEFFREAGIRGIPAVLIKGALVARRAYRPESLRTFIDVDLLVPKRVWEEVRDLMRGMGFESKGNRMKYDSGYGEEEWMHKEHKGCSFEVHWNLVNSPVVRHGLSVTYEDLEVGSDANPLGKSLSSAALMLIASVHGAASHGFDKLQHLCDVAQLARGIAGEIEAPALAEITRATGAGLAVHAALRLAGKLLEEERCLELMSRLGLERHALASQILNRETVIGGPAKRLGSGLRRRAFRQALKLRHA